MKCILSNYSYFAPSVWGLLILFGTNTLNLILVSLVFHYCLNIEFLGQKHYALSRVAYDESCGSSDPSRYVSGHAMGATPISDLMLRLNVDDKLKQNAYDRYYSLYLDSYRFRKDVGVLDIGTSGVELWAAYFEHASHVHGIMSPGKDVADSSCKFDAYKCEKTRIFAGGDPSDALYVKNTFVGHYTYDVIVDDGTRYPMHQVQTFVNFFPLLRPGGMYVIEGIETSYWSQPGMETHGYSLFGAGIGKSADKNAVEKFKQLIDVLQRHHMNYEDLSVLFPESHLDGHIFSLTFGEGLILVRKATSLESEHEPRVYRHNLFVLEEGVRDWESRARDTNP